jgi:hypothetical protein
MFATASDNRKNEARNQFVQKSSPEQETRDKSAADANRASSRQNAHNKQGYGTFVVRLFF